MAPTYPKRTFDQFKENSDEEEPQPGKQMLPVANLPDDYDEEPQDGLQYLFTVRREHRRLPHVTRAVNPYDHPVVAPPQAEHNAEAPKTSSSLPSEEWRTLFVARFRNLRRNAVQPSSPLIGTSKPTLKTASDRSRVCLPDMRDRDRWWAFLQGKPESEWLAFKKAKTNRSRETLHAPIPSDSHNYIDAQRNSPDNLASAASATDSSQEHDNALDTGLTSFEPLSLYKGPNTGATTNPSSNVDDGAENVAFHRSQQMLPQPSDFLFPKVPEPTPRLMRAIDHRYAIHVVMYFAYWLNLHLAELESSRKQAGVSLGTSRANHRFTESHARWMFALLSRIEDHCSADEMSHMRNLARACMRLVKERRKEATAHSDTPEFATQLSMTSAAVSSAPSPLVAHLQAAATPGAASEGVKARHRTRANQYMSENSCWMIIAAIAGVWAQRDLWADAENILA